MGRYDTLTTLRQITQNFRGARSEGNVSLVHDQVRRLARLARIAIRSDETEIVLERLNLLVEVTSAESKIDLGVLEREFVGAARSFS